MRQRIRTIKPEAFADEELWDAEQETGLPLFRGFVGLWTVADREGRFEWRPRPLKAAILPYWDGDMTRVLDACASRGFIVKYASGGREYGWIPTFTRHQSINNREDLSSLPPPPCDQGESGENSDTSTREARVSDASCSREPRVGHAGQVEGKGTEGKGRDPSTRDAHEHSPQELRGLGLALAPTRSRADLMRIAAERFGAAYHQRLGRVWLAKSALDAIIRGAPSMAHRDLADQLEALAEWAEAEPDAVDAIESAVEGAFADQWMTSERYPFAALAKRPARYAARVQTSSLVEWLCAGLRAAFEGERIKSPAPPETADPSWTGWAAIESWIVTKAQLVGRPDRDVGRHLIRCFMRSQRARAAGYPVKFLRENPAEYWRDNLPPELAA